MSYEDFGNFIQYIRTIQEKDDNDLFIGCTGRKGAGKSTFAMQIARAYTKKYFGEKSFNLKKYIAYNNEDVIEKIHTLPKYSPLIADEGVRIAWSRDWNKTENRELAKLSAQIRTKKLIFFLNIPKLSWIDSAYREGMLDIWVWIHSSFTDSGKKGHALVFEADDNQGEGDSWHMDVFRKFGRKKKMRIGRFTSIDKLYNIVKNHPCFLEEFVFPKLPDDLYQRYLVIRDSKAFEQEGRFISQKDTSKLAVYNLKENWKKIVDEVNKTRFKAPTNQLLSEEVFNDPRMQGTSVKETTIRNWHTEMLKANQEIQRKLPALEEQQVQIKEEEDEVIFSEL